jgi:hypothetical protein
VFVLLCLLLLLSFIPAPRRLPAFLYTDDIAVVPGAAATVAGIHDGMEVTTNPFSFFFFSFVVVIPAYRMDNNEAPSARYHPSSSFFWEGIISIRLFILAKLSFSSRMSHRRNAADRQSQVLII